MVIGVVVKLFDLKQKRESEAVQLQAQLSDALLREPSLAGLPLTPTVHVPMWRGTPATIELMGRVPTPELKDTVLRIVRDEAARIRSDVQIEDRLYPSFRPWHASRNAGLRPGGPAGRRVAGTAHAGRPGSFVQGRDAVASCAHPAAVGPAD